MKAFVLEKIEFENLSNIFLDILRAKISEKYGMKFVRLKRHFQEGRR